MNDRGPVSMIPTLEFLVPLRILELRSGGGVHDDDLERATAFLPSLIGHADSMMYGTDGERDKYAVVDATGRRVGMLARLVDAIAVLSFLPGGITLFEHHWESRTLEDEQCSR